MRLSLRILDDGGAYRPVFGGESVSVQLHEREFVYIYTAMTPASAGPLLSAHPNLRP